MTSQMTFGQLKPVQTNINSHHKAMKKILKFMILSSAVLITGCKDDTLLPDRPLIGYEEGDVVFTVANEPNTRTMYQDNWDETEPQQIFWGNYLTDVADNIKVYCKAAVQQQICTYQVNPQGVKSHIAESITKITPKSMQWGNQNETHNFYAFYPADLAGDAFLNGSDNTISAEIEINQSPVKFTGVYGSGANQTTLEGLQAITDHSTASEANSTVVYGLPNMRSAIMVAQKEMTPQEYGNPVPLQFNVLADVLDLTINGPVTPNTLGGNGNSRAFIEIYSVTITGPENSVLSGTFNINMADGTVSNAVGENEIYIPTSNTNNNVRLHVRSDKDMTGIPTEGQIDHFRLRAFLVPGQITDMSNLTITVSTDCGEYQQKLDAATMVTGHIHPIKLKYFKEPGIEFDFTKWLSQLNDDIFLSELSIPGSWHTANSAYQGSAAGDLQAQYDAGIRAFEVHTKNGTTLMDYDDMTKVFSNSNIQYTEPYSSYGNITTTTNGSNAGEIQEGSSTTETNWTSTQQTETQTVTQSGWVLAQNRTLTNYMIPKFSLRLYRTSDDITSATSMSDNVITLANKMNPTGIMFFEFGMDGQAAVSNVPAQETGQVSYTRSKTFTRAGTRTRTRTRTSAFRDWPAWPDWQTDGSDITWDEDPDLFTDNDQWQQTGSSTASSTTTTTVDGQAAWAIAVESCIRRLAKTDNTATKKKILYNGEILASTTLGDVRGQCIAKVNTNGEGNEENGWFDQVPAIFSRWIEGSGSEPLTINLQWGSPVAPFGTGGVPTTPLRWCFTELDNIANSVTIDDKTMTGLEMRQQAIDKFLDMSFANYTGGLHRTFYECAIGGGSGAVSPTEVATSLNKYMSGKLKTLNRKASPLGLVFMNFVVDDSNTYGSKELIRLIINNNRAFTMNRRGVSKKNVGDNTNSSFTNNSNNPLK